MTHQSIISYRGTGLRNIYQAFRHSDQHQSTRHRTVRCWLWPNQTRSSTSNKLEDAPVAGILVRWPVIPTRRPCSSPNWQLQWSQIGAVNMWSGKPHQTPRCFLLCCRTTSITLYHDFNRKRRVRECNRSCFLRLNIETKPIAPIVLNLKPRGLIPYWSA